MRKYVAQRLLLFIPTLVILSLVVFGLMRVLPGDVAMRILSGEEGLSSVSGLGLDQLREMMGLNRPLHIQYLTWLWDLARGDLGVSLITREPVGDGILQRLAVTVQLALMAKILSILIGVPLGIISAIRRNSWTDYISRFFAIIFLAVPNFWLAIMLVLAGALWFNWSAPLGYNLLWEHPRENLAQLMWPALILATGGMAIMARITRSSMLEVLGEDYIRTARAKGLGENVVILRHALKNAMIPVVTLAGLSFGNLLGGTVILEAVFGIPGMGSWFIESIRLQDYTVVQGVVVIFGVFFMGINLVVDLLYGWLDPRISYAR